jgi:hypothetical protein
MTNIRNSILAGIGFGVLFGIFLAIRFNLNYALIAGPLSGLMFGTILYFFVNSNMIKRQTSIEIDEGKIIRSGGANHFLNKEAVGGKLYLLEDKIIFKSHNFNTQNHKEEYLLNNITKIEFCNTLGIIPNGMKILMNENQSEQFVLNNRKFWKKDIEDIITRHNN